MWRPHVAAVLLSLFLRGDGFHCPCPAQLPCARPSSNHAGAVWPRASSARESQQDATAGQGGVGVPGMLRDVIVEKIEELGGGKVKEVSRIS